MEPWANRDRGPLQVGIQKLSGDFVELHFEADKLDVSVLKSRIEKEMGVPIPRQRLHRRDSMAIVQDSDTLTDSCQLSLTVVPLGEHITLVVGDPFDKDIGGDEVHIKANMSPEELQEAYEKGCEMMGCNLQMHCQYNDEWTLPADVCAKFEEHGFDFSTLQEVEGIEEAATEGLNLKWARREAWPMLWLFVARLGAPYLEYEYEGPPPNRIEIGGHGLYCDC